VAIRVSRGGAPEPDPSSVVGAVYTLSPTTTAFGAGTQLRLRFQPGGMPRGLARTQVGIRDQQLGAWRDLPSTVAIAEDVVTAPVTTLGTFSAGRARPATPCTSAADRAFDFWVGLWRVAAGPQLQNIAESDITLEPGGCAVFEEYRDLGGTVGRSINFRSSNGQWHQTYVDNRGGRISLTGDLQSPGVMRMDTQPGATVFERWSWIANADGSVRQVGEATQNGGTTFATPHWDGRYTRR